MPGVGDELAANQPMGTIESVKTVSDLFSPVDGKVVRVNEDLPTAPEKVNADPYGEGWIVEVEFEGDPTEAVGELMDAGQYEAPLARK